MKQNPDPYTLRELEWMAEGHCREAWDRFACLMAVMVNLQIDTKKTKPVKPALFNPYTSKEANQERIGETNAVSARLIDQAIAKQEKPNGQ